MEGSLMKRGKYLCPLALLEGIFFMIFSIFKLRLLFMRSFVTHNSFSFYLLIVIADLIFGLFFYLS